MPAGYQGSPRTPVRRLPTARRKWQGIQPGEIKRSVRKQARLGLCLIFRPMTSSPSQPPISKRELRLVYAGLMLALTLASLDQNIVSTALPRIVSDLGGLSHLSWVVTAFMVTSTITMPLYGKLSDMYGRK